MALKTTPWDSAEYLKTEDDIAAYLEASFAEAPDDPAFLVQALGVVARACNISQLARETGLTREGLYKWTTADFSDTTKRRTILALGLSLNR